MINCSSISSILKYVTTYVYGYTLMTNKICACVILNNLWSYVILKTVVNWT